MHKVAEAASVAFSILVLATAGFAEVGDGGEFSVEWAACGIKNISILNRKVSWDGTYLHTSDR
jgi:hypothetical protein